MRQNYETDTALYQNTLMDPVYLIQLPCPGHLTKDRLLSALPLIAC